MNRFSELRRLSVTPQRKPPQLDEISTQKTAVDQPIVDTPTAPGPLAEEAVAAPITPEAVAECVVFPPVGSSPLVSRPVVGEPIGETSAVLSPILVQVCDDKTVGEQEHSDLRAALASLRQGLPKPKAARTVQDGHSDGEHRVYESLWKYSTPFSEDARIISIGYSALSAFTGMTVANCRANLFSLMGKLAIEEYALNTQTATKTYLVFSFSSILRRRREAGFTHIVRTKGVAFVDPETGERLTRQPGEFRRSGKALLGETTIGEKTAAHADLAGATIGEKVRRTVGDKTTLSYRFNSFSESTTSVRRLLQEQLPAFDDEAVDELWCDCRRRVPDVTPEEVSAMFASKLPGSQSRSIENPNGFLIKAVARSCTPAAIGALRQGREVAPEIPIVISAEDLEEILADPNMPEDMRKLAEERLKGRTR